MPFLSKDEFKERLYEVFGEDDSLEPQIERAALSILFSVAASQLHVGVSVVVESNFDAGRETTPLRRLAETNAARIVQVHLGGPADEVVEAFARRAESGERHPGHGDEPGDAEEVRANLRAGRWEPLDLPGELLKASMHADKRELTTRVRAALDR